MQKIGKIAFFVGASGILFVGGLFVGIYVGENHPKTIVVQGVDGIDAQGNAASVDFSTFWQAWDLIDTNYLNAEKVSANTRVYGALGGLISSLGDPHSVFFNPENSKRFEEDVEGSFGGIGAEISSKKNQIVIIAPLKGSPAERAGLKAGDAIYSVNTSSTEGLSVDEAVTMIRGPKGTPVTLTIMREELEKPKDIKIVRDTITAPTLDFAMKDSDIAYVQLYSFNANASQLFYDAMLKALTQGSHGLVLDLRNNPGGYLEVAVQLAGWFLPRDTVVVSEATRAGVDEVFRAKGNSALAKFPVVVLVNGGSASASEILAGTLRDNRNVKLIGETTFGKGTVQQVLDLKDGSSMKITIAHWVLPSGKILENGGLEPDIIVKPSEDDVESENDVQLTKALEVMRGMIEKD